MADEITEAELAAAVEILDTLDTAATGWRFDHEQYNVAVAAAGAVRATGFLREALVLADQSPAIGGNVLVRAAFEAWLTGAWVLFAGDEGILGMELRRIRAELRLLDANDHPAEVRAHVQAQLDEALAIRDELFAGNEPRSVKFEQMAQNVSPLIRERTGESTASVESAYDLLYRTHSEFDAHPYKVLGQSIRHDERHMWAVPVDPWIPPKRSVATMANLVAMLGKWIDTEIGADRSRWDRLLDVVIAARQR